MTEDRFHEFTPRLAAASMPRRGAIGVIGGALAGAATSFGGARVFAQTGSGNNPPPQLIYVIRHGEKPPDPPPGHATASPGPPFGVDIDGNRNPHSLAPRGWQRSGALAVLFSVAAAQSGLRTPTALYAPSYGDPAQTRIHRSYQTIECLGRRLGVPIRSPVSLGQEAVLVQTIMDSGEEVVLTCWEHQRIPALAQAIPTVDAAATPAVWPDSRFDVIWTFTLDPATGRYVFGQVPEQLLDDDPDTVISLNRLRVVMSLRSPSDRSTPHSVG